MNPQADLGVIGDEARLLAEAMLQVSVTVVVFALGSALILRRLRAKPETKSGLARVKLSVLVLIASPLVFALLYNHLNGMYEMTVFLVVMYIVFHSGSAPRPRQRVLAIISVWTLLLGASVLGSRLEALAQTSAPEAWQATMIHDFAYKMSFPQMRLLENMGQYALLGTFETHLDRIAGRAAGSCGYLLGLGSLAVAFIAFGIRPVLVNRARPWTKVSTGMVFLVAFTGLSCWFWPGEVIASPRLAAAAATLSWYRCAALLAPLLICHGLVVGFVLMRREVPTTRRALVIMSLLLLVSAGLMMAVWPTNRFCLRHFAQMGLSFPALLSVGLILRSRSGWPRVLLLGSVCLLIALLEAALTTFAVFGLVACLFVGSSPSTNRTAPVVLIRRRYFHVSVLAAALLVAWPVLVLLSIPSRQAAHESGTVVSTVPIDVTTIEGDLHEAAESVCKNLGAHLCLSREIAVLRQPDPQRIPQFLVLGDVIGAETRVFSFEAAWLLPWPNGPVLAPRPVVPPRGMSATLAASRSEDPFALCCQ